VIVVGARPEMRIMREEVFAPMLAVMSVNSDGEALHAAGECPYALGAAIFGPPRRAEALAGRIRAGVVVINDLIVPTADPRLPFGGRGRSGYGLTRGAVGLLELTVAKVVVRRRGRFRPHFDPIGKDDAELASAYLTTAHGAFRDGRWRAAATLARMLIRRARNRGGSP
jgi:hypothetical protein